MHHQIPGPNIVRIPIGGARGRPHAVRARSGNLPGLTAQDIIAEIDRVAVSRQWPVDREGPPAASSPNWVVRVTSAAASIWRSTLGSAGYCPDNHIRSGSRPGCRRSSPGRRCGRPCAGKTCRGWFHIRYRSCAGRPRHRPGPSARSSARAGRDTRSGDSTVCQGNWRAIDIGAFDEIGLAGARLRLGRLAQDDAIAIGQRHGIQFRIGDQDRALGAVVAKGRHPPQRVGNSLDGIGPAADRRGGGYLIRVAEAGPVTVTLSY